ncbi:efflux RND transporter permease subunit [Hippea jasoniae]|uniref:efflux RND transporter permease subunit n=1 Tax=Hippea jasoniae TaxID=944479 RepID=UPI0005598076|nr:efflux RND transporter permease subunit [Hippea jasoniae]
MFEYFYKRPHTLFSLIVLLFVLGVIGLINLPKNLFPDSARPTVLIMTRVPGASAVVVANSVSKPIEEEVSTLGYVRQISSINMPNMSVVNVEFEYKKGLKNAALDVVNALARVSSKLPKGAKPTIYTVGSFTLPVDVIAVYPKKKYITLTEVRKIADSFIKPYLLSLKGIGNVEVFGGYKSAINIAIDPYKLAKYNLTADKVIAAIAAFNKDIPIGFFKSKNNFITVTYYGERDEIERLKLLEVAPNIPLKSIAEVSWSHQKNFSSYIGNSHPAIAIAIQRTKGGNVLKTSDIVRNAIRYLKKEYPNLNFEISDTQRNLIETSNSNMLEALRDAIVYTLIVILIFLGNFRAIIAAGLSIPMVFFSTLAIIWLAGGELNIVVYTAIILALGMLTDDAVVVLENIERHLNELKEDLGTAIEHGTKEVVGPVFAGTISTVALLFPMMFVGDYPQRIFFPLISTLILALLISYFLSITFIPKLSYYLYKNGTSKTRVELFFERIYQNTFGRLIGLYLGALEFSNSKRRILRRVIMVVGVLFILIFSVKNIMPVIGRDIMPPMDTGIIEAKISFSPNLSTQEAQNRLMPFLNWLKKQKYVQMSSVAFGSELGVTSFGGNLPQQAQMTIICVDRFHRKQTIWQLESVFRNRLHNIRGIEKVDVYDFGATPLSSINAPLAIRLESPVYYGLPEASQKVKKAIEKIKGLTSVSISWKNDMQEIKLKIDAQKALSYGLTPFSIISQIPINGRIASISGDLSSMNVQPIRIYLRGKYNENLNYIKLLPIKTPYGYYIPLKSVAHFEKQFAPAKIVRYDLMYADEVDAFRNKKPISIITSESQQLLKKLDLKGFVVKQAGSIVQLNDSFKRMIKAILIGVILLISVLTAVYRSFKLAIVMIVVLPLAMIGASWGMLILNKPSCMPSLMGILLLFGIIIKNSVLLVDFYKEYRKKESPFESALESIRVRFRPVMMTAFGTIAGMIPIALEKAVGLERLSPLADVAIGGLLVGTFLTLVYVPMFAYLFDKKD